MDARRGIRSLIAALLALAITATGIQAVFSSGEPKPAAPMTAQTVRLPHEQPSPQGSN